MPPCMTSRAVPFNNSYHNYYNNTNHTANCIQPQSCHVDVWPPENCCMDSSNTAILKPSNKTHFFCDFPDFKRKNPLKAHPNAAHSDKCAKRRIIRSFTRCYYRPPGIRHYSRCYIPTIRMRRHSALHRLPPIN